LRNVDISRNSNGHISILREAIVWYAHAGRPTGSVHADVTLTGSKVEVKVTGLLKLENCRKLHFSR